MNSSLQSGSLLHKLIHHRTSVLHLGTQQHKAYHRPVQSPVILLVRCLSTTLAPLLKRAPDAFKDGTVLWAMVPNSMPFPTYKLPPPENSEKSTVSRAGYSPIVRTRIEVFSAPFPTYKPPPLENSEKSTGYLGGCPMVGTRTGESCTLSMPFPTIKPPENSEKSTGCLRGCLVGLCCCCVVDACF